MYHLTFRRRSQKAFVNFSLQEKNIQISPKVQIGKVLFSLKRKTWRIIRKRNILEVMFLLGAINAKVFIAQFCNMKSSLYLKLDTINK